MADKPSYPPPLDQLLKLGEDAIRQRDWPDYLAMGITAEHIPELIRMSTDEELLWAPSNSKRVWAPVHAWRALGELRAAEAIEPLLALFEELEDDDWISEEMPSAFGLIGPPAIPALAALLANQEALEGARINACEALFAVTQFYPETEHRVAELLFRQLMRFADQPKILNGFLVLRLVHLRFTRAESLMQLAFKFDKVDESIMGDWDMVREELLENDPEKLAEHREREEYRVAGLRQHVTRRE